MNEICHYLMAMSEDGYDEDVIIEGGELHKALTSIGCTDFECTRVLRNEFYDLEDYNSSAVSPVPESPNKWRWNIFHDFSNTSWLHRSSGEQFYGLQYLQIILKLDPVLDDHALAIQRMVDEGRTSQNYISPWPSSMTITSLLAASTLLYKPTRTAGLLMFTSLTSIMGYRRYIKFNSIKRLNELVSIQNDIYYLYKRSLKILKNGFGIKMSVNKPQKRFSNLESRRLKYLQPLCEVFVLSMEKTTRTFYETSLLLLNILPKTYNVNNLITRFNCGFTVTGELTYEKLKQLYYVYILVQSDMMQLLAFLYNENSISHGRFCQLTKIITNLSRLLSSDKVKLTKIVEEYSNCKAVPLHHELRKRVGAKWQDLYMHVDMLSRKIQSAYSIIGSVVDDIDSCTDFDGTDEFIDSLMQKMNAVYKEIDTARNFAEFNNLLIGKFRNIKSNGNGILQQRAIIDTVEQERNIVYDTDPMIIDEVFEEYIKEEYLKPLYEENDFDYQERAKLDKLLEKNFMSELKEVLIDKYRTMSEREARALSRYRKNIDDDEEMNVENCKNNLIIPPPPPLPMRDTQQPLINDQASRNRPPMPLPRTINLTQHSEIDSTLHPAARCCRKYGNNSSDEETDVNERFSINLNVERIRLPAFTTTEETFVGSGENSEVEVINSDYESD